MQNAGLPAQVPDQTHRSSPDELEISLIDIVRSVWAGRKLIAFLTAGCVALALGGAFLMGQYKSESYYYFGGSFAYGENPNLGGYNRFISTAKTPERFETWLRAMKLEDLPEAEALHALFASREGIQGQIKPIHPELIKSKPNAAAPVLGIKVELSAKKPQDAYKALALLSRYLADALAYDTYQGRLVEKLSGVLTQHEAIENELFQLKVQRPHLERQQVLVEALVEKYARFFETGQRAEMLISPESALGTSPISQLMGLQLELAKLDQKNEALMRQQKQVGLYQAFYQQAHAAWQTQQTAERFVQRLPQILPEVFKRQDLNDEAIKEAFNKLSIETQQMQNLWQENQRNLIAPSMATVPTVRFALVGAGALVAGLFLSMLIVLFRAWWREAAAQKN